MSSKIPQGIFIDGTGSAVPPIYAHVKIYFIQAGFNSVQATEFYKLYQDNSWRNSRGHVIKNWKELAWRWTWMKTI